MIDTLALKKYIFDNEKIEYVLKEIGCHHIQYHPHKEYWSCGNHNGDNTNAINVKNNSYLNVVNWTRMKDFDDNADIITLVEYNIQCSFKEAVKYLHRILGLEYKWQKKHEKQEKKFDPLYIFKKVSCKNKVDVNDIHALDEELLDDYVPLLWYGWYKEGIMPWSREKFNIAYSYRKKRIIIPIYHWLTNELIGLNMRTTISNYEELGIPKYWITPTYQKSANLYGLAQNYDEIVSKKVVTVFEGEKSTLKRFSLTDGTCVSLQGKTISDEQRRILIGLNSEIVIALDADVNINEIRHMCEKFYRIRTVSYIFDRWGLLGEKDSPADKGDKIYKFLFKYRVKYDESEHRKYLNSLRE